MRAIRWVLLVAFVAAAIYVTARSVTFGETWCGTLLFDRHDGGPCESSNRNRELLVLLFLGLATLTGISLWWSSRHDRTSAEQSR